VRLRTLAAYIRVGDLRVALGEDHAALEAYRQAMSMIVERLDAGPASDRDRATLAEVLGKFGKILRRNSTYGPAEWTFNESVRLFREIVDHDPRVAGSRLALAHARNQLASLQGETGRIEEALAESKEALDLLLSLRRDTAEMNGDEPLLLKKELTSIYSNLGKWLQLGGRLAEAEDVYRKVLAMEKQLLVEGAGVPDIRESIALSQAMLGELLRATRRNDEAEVQFKQAIAGLEGLVADYPRMPRYRSHLGRIYDVLSTLYWSTDRVLESDEARRKAESFSPHLRHGQQVQLNNLAWYLLTSPNPAARKDPRRALELAIKALELNPDHWGVLNTLGIARYRNGDWAGAKQVLEEAIRRKSSRFSFDGYFLAMTYWRMGQQAQAREVLERAEHWRLTHEPDDVELLRFRAEAEQLVGPILCRDHVPVPRLPSSVAEAIRNPWFSLPKKECEQRAISSKQGECGGSGEAQKSELKVSEAVDTALFFIDLS